MNMDPTRAMMLIQEYNRDPRSFSDKDALFISAISKELGMPFKKESQPLKKFLYSAGEMATFGLLPDSWEPRSRGEEVYGESAIDAMASGAGSLLGLVGGITGAYKGARGIFGSQRAKDIGGKVVDATKTADDMILGGRGRSALRNVRARADTFFDRQVGNIGYY